MVLTVFCKRFYLDQQATYLIIIAAYIMILTQRYKTKPALRAQLITLLVSNDSADSK